MHTHTHAYTQTEFPWQVHCYAAASEPFGPWAGLERGSPAYEAAKAAAAEPLWRALEAIIPDVRARAEV